MSPAETKTPTETPAEASPDHAHEHQPEIIGPRSECEREITIEVPKEVVRQETDTVLAKYQKLARVPGFRKGKVPLSLIQRQFAKDIKQEIIEKLVPRFIQQQTREQNLTPISQPRITDLHAPDLDAPEGDVLSFTAVFEIMPDVQLGDYKSHGVHQPRAEATDDEVNQEIESLRERQASYDAVEEDRALEDGDYASINFEGNPKLNEGEAAGPGSEPATMEDVLVEIGGVNTVPEFTENLRGAKAGEERTFDVVYPSDFAEPRLAGRTVSYNAKVNGIKRKSLPELNDDFASELGKFENLEDLKQQLRNDMREQKQSAAETQAKDKLLDYLIANSKFPVPESFIAQQIDVRLNRGLQALAQQGMKPDDMRKLNLERLRGGQRDAAIREVRAAMLLDKIADTEKIEVSDEELDHDIQALAVHSGEDYTGLHARLTRDGSLERIRERMRNEKTLNHLLQS
ncbi:MAG: trigger factor [Acidobacteriaceae bacterium]